MFINKTMLTGNGPTHTWKNFDLREKITITLEDMILSFFLVV